MQEGTPIPHTEFEIASKYEIACIVAGMHVCSTYACVYVCVCRESLLKDFHRAPVRWWEKVISDRGNHARLSLVALKRAQAVVTAHNGGDTDLDISTDSGYASR